MVVPRHVPEIFTGSDQLLTNRSAEDSTLSRVLRRCCTLAAASESASSRAPGACKSLAIKGRYYSGNPIRLPWHASCFSAGSERSPFGGSMANLEQKTAILEVTFASRQPAQPILNRL